MFFKVLTVQSAAESVMCMGAKDWIVEKAALAMLNQSVLRPYGALTELKLDLTKCSLEAALELKGETELVRIQIHEYELIDPKGDAHLVIKSLTTSREWVTKLAQNFLVGRRLKIPESMRAFLPMLT